MSPLLRMLAATLVALFVVGPVSAATTSLFAPLQVAQNAGSVVSGNVADQTGAPLAKAHVELRGATTYSADTDAQGNFSIPDVNPGIYSVTITKAGYNLATQEFFAVTAGQPEMLSIRMQALNFQSLQTIAVVRTAGKGTFNTTPAAINTVTPQTLRDQATPQVYQVLNQTPGIVASLPQSSANEASPGAITFPNIRGALSFETASLIDGHPISVGSFGDYVSTFLSGFALGGIEVVKGPGADAPQVNYAIGGTVNFLTREPSYKPDGEFMAGISNFGGLLSNIGFSNTVGRLSFALNYSYETDDGGFRNYQAMFNPGPGSFINGQKLGFNDGNLPIAGTDTNYFGKQGIVVCCQTINGGYSNYSALAKVRYQLSDATTATFTYFGTQTTADQNANTSSQTLAVFTPGTGGAYTGSIAAGSPITTTNLHPGTDTEVNSEPIVEGDLRTTLGNDTILGRYYSAGIHRLVNQGGPLVSTPQIFMVTAFGTNCGNTVGCPATAANTFNGQLVPMSSFNYFNQAENDALSGYSLEYSHPFGSNDNDTLTLSYDATSSTTQSYNIGANANATGTSATPSLSTTIPQGGGQIFSTALVRGSFRLNSKLSTTLSLYGNRYRSTYAARCGSGSGAAFTTATCAIDGSNAFFQTTTRSHFDPRLGVELRPSANLALRFSAGSSIAPPFLAELNQQTGLVNFTTGNTFATQTVNAGTLLPETAFGYDLGASYRFHDPATTVSIDGYSTTLWNHFISQLYNSGVTCDANTPVGSGTACPVGTPIYYTSNVNLSNSRYQGIELQLRRQPAAGLGFTLQGATMRGYAYNLPACFYTTQIVNGVPDCAVFNKNVAIVPNVNFTGGTGGGQIAGQNGVVYPGVNGNNPIAASASSGYSNQNIPYLMGYGELSYTLKNSARVAVGETLFGKNNSLNRPPFGVVNVSLRYPVAAGFDAEVAGSNVTNTYSGLFPVYGGASVGIPLANGQIGGTEGNVLGPASWRFVLIKHLGGE